ncbi:PREDICTED: UDP-glycosyltransferase [Prunus dulcis]|uniref:PREDICTED: UDP-glycosyltransferase n=1 Tax=Prunus dulcis TaxID=3755 RepID=A0A5E4FSV2_PRUDU|nr:PREDICTED: UDP-glycosyltransferase [Prunus dulcis]
MILVKELKVAIEVEREENGWFSKESLSKTITTMMDKENELGVSLKKNLEKWRRKLSEPGFMSGYIDRFIQNLKEFCKVVNEL